MSSWIDPLVEVLIFSLVETLILRPQIPIPRLPRIASSGAAIVLVSRRLGVCQAFVGRSFLYPDTLSLHDTLVPDWTMHRHSPYWAFLLSND